MKYWTCSPPDFNGRRLSYNEYVSTFTEDFHDFYPSKQKEPVNIHLGIGVLPKRDSSMMVWGTQGAYCDHYRDPLLRGEFPRFMGFIDGNSNLHGTEVDGYPVYAPSELPKLQPETVVIASWADMFHFRAGTGPL